MLYFLFRLVWYFLLVYVYGLFKLIFQLCQTHHRVSGLPLQVGKVAIVTGGACGIGFHISKGLVAKNVHVFIGCKTSQEGKAAISDIREEFPNAKVDFILLDLRSLQSVKDFAEDFLSRNLGLHILINNAGILFPPYEETEDRFESTLQVNYLSHFYLTLLLLDRLKSSGTDNSWSRIVNISSAVQVLGNPNVETLGQRCKFWYEFSPHQSYIDSKLMIIASSNYLNSILHDNCDKVAVNSLHPGIVDSNLIRHVHWFIRPIIALISRIFYLSTEQGADTPLFVAMSPVVEGQGGDYFDNCEVIQPATMATGRDFQEGLWTRTMELIEEAVSKLKS